ncbi:WYL domain-containing protein [Dermacoccus nishinomiyaensis]
MHPLICFIREGRWYLLRHDLHRRDWRVFRLDRITSATADPAVTGRSPPTFPDESLERWLTSDFDRRSLPADHLPGGNSATSRGDDESASAEQDGG